jgi:hypothetical protein
LALGAGEAHQLLVSSAKHLRHRALSHLLTGGVNRGQVLGFPEAFDEAIRRAPRSANLARFIKDDAPAGDREECQQIEHALHDRAGARDHGEEVVPARRADGVDCQEIQTSGRVYRPHDPNLSAAQSARRYYSPWSESTNVLNARRFLDSPNFT